MRMNCACVFSLDDAYVMPFKVFFHSLQCTESIPEEIPIYILHTKALSNKSISSLHAFFSQYARSATFLDASDLIPNELPIPKNTIYSPATFYRLFIANILPLEIHKVVYLDADMIALRSISELFRLNFDEPVCAVDHLSPFQSLRLWGEKAGPYFQAGVLLISLTQWRDLDVSKEFLAIISSEWDRLKCVDQDVLNIMFRNRWCPLPIWYNIEEGALRALPVSTINDNVRIIHFSGVLKPWNSYNPSPFTDYWDQSYAAVFGQSFNRKQLKPTIPLRSRLKRPIGHLSSLIHFLIRRN